MEDDIIDDRLMGEGRFSELFPKTFSYLEIYVNEVYPKYPKNKIPDPKMELRLFNPFEHSLLGELKDKKIIIYLDAIASTIYSDKKLKSMENSDYNALTRYIDSIPKLKATLIHEYTHYLQDKKMRQEYILGHKAKIMPKTFKATPQHLQGVFDYASRFHGLFEGYGLRWDEVDARISEWIYLKTRGYDENTISRFDYMMDCLRTDPKKIKKDIESIENELVRLDSLTFLKRIWNKGRYHRLMLLKESYREIDSIYEKINVFSEKIANRIKEKYDRVEVS